MPFNNSKNGYQNELDFIKKINNKKIKELNFSLQLFIKDIFDKTTENDIVKCYKNIKKQKYDIFIKINDNIKLISIKKGVKNSVHAEPISEFIHFLIENKMPRQMVINFLKYHYADGTTNGSGKRRIGVEEYKKTHQVQIDEINRFLNQREILKKAIDRFIVKGRNSKKRIDAILYGVPEDFIWIKTKDIYEILLLKKDEYSTSIHFSHLTYQPLNRCLNYNPRYEKDRYISQIKWYTISDDIIDNMNNKVIETTAKWLSLSENL